MNDLEVDVLTSLPGKISFESIYERSIVVSYKGVPITAISIRDQIELLKAAGRDKDIKDIRFLKEPAKEGQHGYRVTMRFQSISYIHSGGGGGGCGFFPSFSG